ncbi:MAG: isoleucyl-tRNA synthetase [Edafosvirus sp.]|uniref:isoleucine--tRNA ligase n=1 Tax=Edafosvirus sp. TaxID=2487765 RepID=A0A3G4ZUY7_9VIRU|nr:MAG: isoleucyl-tRNA synthetase [Edafosvirus sp.]
MEVKENYFTYEQSILNFWKDKDIYKKLLEQNKKNPIFRFMDGPPFVSSDSLHYGHLLIGFIKSTILFYKQMKGFNCLNKLGYDVHGLPIEMVVNKKLNVNMKRDVEALGIDVYNKTCKDLINSYSKSWSPIYDRIGRWADFDNTYKTMDTNYMESVWWVFSELWDKNLIYKGFRVMPFSTKCGTSLSNFEASQTYNDINEDSAYVFFPLKEDEKVGFVAWTTTPWTLPSHITLCLNPTEIYVKVTDSEKKDRTYIVLDKCVKNLPIKNPLIEVIGPGETLKNMEYIPPFNYFNREYRTITDTFVEGSGEIGTGIVHLAPSFGIEDFDVCIKYNIVSLQDIGNKFCPVDDDGCFTDIVSDYKGKHVLETNKPIIKYLQEKNKLVKKQMYKHSYPFCPRTDTPLIYKTVSSFFVKVTDIKDKIIANNEKIKWTPDFVGSKRFKNWLEGTKDWGISRSRFFGTPIPVWISDDKEEMICVKSIDDLMKKAGLTERPTDLHLETISKIQIPSQQGKGMLRLSCDLFDCWYESGCVPIAQIHYPFENKELLDNTEYLSDFISEGLDQVRGWFYTLMVLSTAIFDKPAFKQVICAGLVLAEDGKKMAKRLNNFKDPKKVIDLYGADALRLYMLSSQATKAEPVQFKERDIAEISKKSLILLVNAFKFLSGHYERFKECGLSFDNTKSINVMDMWIESRLYSLINNIEANLEEYELSKCVTEIIKYIDELTNWYIKMNRDRMKGRLGDAEWITSLSTLYKILNILVITMAPFTPFNSEYLYNELNKLVNQKDNIEYKESVHLLPYYNKDLLTYDKQLEIKFLQFQRIVNAVRNVRGMRNLNMKKPIKKVIVCHNDEKFIENIKNLEMFLLSESNILEMGYDSNISKYVKYKFKLNMAGLKQKLKTFDRSNEMKKFIDWTTSATEENITEFVNNETINVYNMELDKEILEIVYDTVNLPDEYKNYSQIIDKDVMTLVDLSEDEEMINKYHIKMFCTTIQMMRKKMELKPADKIEVYYYSDNKKMIDLIDKNMNEINSYLCTKPMNITTIMANSEEVNGIYINIKKL